MNLDELGGAADEELMEFQELEPAFGEPEPGAWETPAAGDGAVAWDAPAAETPKVEWDEQSDWSSPAEEEADTWETEAEEAEPAWEAPAVPTAEQDWSESPAAEPGWHEPAMAPDLDEKTRQDLAALEAQLAELEAELAKRPKRRDETDEH